MTTAQATGVAVRAKWQISELLAATGPGLPEAVEPVAMGTGTSAMIAAGSSSVWARKRPKFPTGAIFMHRFTDQLEAGSKVLTKRVMEGVDRAIVRAVKEWLAEQRMAREAA